MARALSSNELAVCFCTQFNRTRQTAEIVSKKAAAKLMLVEAGREAELAKRISEEHKDQSVLIVGHSNTVPEIVRHFGISTKLTIEESDYDNLLVVTLCDDAKPRLLHLHYGAEKDGK